jgi:hypothetical protein
VCQTLKIGSSKLPTDVSKTDKCYTKKIKYHCVVVDNFCSLAKNEQIQNNCLNNWIRVHIFSDNN